MNEKSSNALSAGRTIGSVIPKLNDKENALIVDDEIIIIFTKQEYKIVSALIGNVIVDDQTLIDLLFEAKKMDKQLRITLKRHIANAQGKLRPSSLYIHRVHGYGYSLLERREKQMAI